MELGSALPAELLTACQPAGGAAPALQRRAAADPADDSPAPAGFDLLLQMLLGQPPAGEPLPAAGKDLPPSSAIPVAGPALTASLSTPAATVEPAGAPALSPIDGAAPADDPAAALRAALAAASPDSGRAGGSTRAPSTPAKPAHAEPLPLPPPSAAVLADLPAADAPHDGAVLEASPAPQPPALQPPVPAAAASVAAAAAADSSRAAVAVAAIAPSVATDASDVARPRVRAANASTAQPGTSAPAIAGVDAAVTPAGGDEAAAPSPPAPAAPAQATELRTVQHDEPIPLVLQAADGADSGGAPLGHAAAHAAGVSGSTAAASNAPQPAQPALPQTPVDTTAGRWHEALASRVHWLVDHGVGEARIRLNPPELGALDVKVSLQDDKTFVQVTAHTAAARDELTQSLPRLRELLSAGGLNLGGATVSGGRDDRAGRYAAEPPRPAGFAGGIEPVFAPHAARSSARGLVDLFA